MGKAKKIARYLQTPAQPMKTEQCAKTSLTLEVFSYASKTKFHR